MSLNVFLINFCRVHCKEVLMLKNNLDENSRACPVCNEPHVHLQQLVIHIAQKHEQLKELVGKDVFEKLANCGQTKLQCDKCKRICTNKGALGRHRGACLVAIPPVS